MVTKSAPAGSTSPRPPSPEKEKSSKGKKEKGKAQGSWVGTVARTRDRYPLPSLHLRVSLTDLSRPWLGKWNQARRGNDNIEVVRTKSQAGMLRPRRMPTIYRSNTHLYLDADENPVTEIARRRKSIPESEKQTVVVDLPERVEMHLAAISTEKQSVVLEMPNGVELVLSPRIERVEPGPSRFEELNDDASVHELEAVYHNENSSTDEQDDDEPNAVILCEADDPTALTAIELLQRSLTIDLRKARPKISVAIPRSKSLHIPSDSTPHTTTLTSPLSPPSTSLMRSQTQRAIFRSSLVSPLSSADAHRTGRTLSTVSVPLFMEASDPVDFDEIPPLPATAAEIAQKYGGPVSGTTPSPLTKASRLAVKGRSPSVDSPSLESIISPLTPSPQAARKNIVDVAEEAEPVSSIEETPIDPPFVKAATSIPEPSPAEGSSSASTPTPSDDAGSEESTEVISPPRRFTEKHISESLNKPLPPEPLLPPLDPLRPLTYTAKLSKSTRSNENLPRSKYASAFASTHVGRFEELRRMNKGRSTSVDEAMEELEWRLSSICEKRLPKRLGTHGTQMSRESDSTLPARTPPPVPRSDDTNETIKGRCSLTRSCSANLPSVRSPYHKERKSRSLQDLSRSASFAGDMPPAEESETWYRTASERSSAHLGSSVFSEAATDGTSQTEQSGQEKALASADNAVDAANTVSTVDSASTVKPASIVEPASTVDDVDSADAVDPVDAKDSLDPSQPAETVDEVESPVREVEDTPELDSALINNVELPRAMQSQQVAADVAEAVVLRIMSNLTTLKDLFATAALNKGFYNTFKRHEIFLIKSTLYKSSVQAWELRETCEDEETTPTAYLRQYSVEIYTMGMLKSLILVQCESFLRVETIHGLVGTDQDQAADVDAAFWRVWTFCQRFGSSAGGNENVDEQIDWLNGGKVAREKDPSSVFGIGNDEGLTKEEIYDMLEIWNCLRALVQAFHTRIKEARQVGIFDHCKAESKREQELLLEEWTAYILTLGPSCILALAPGSFQTAKELGLAEWEPPSEGPGNSRATFCRDALIRVYESRLMEDPSKRRSRAKRSSKASSRRMTKTELAREIDRARQTAFAKELRSQRQHSPSKADNWSFSDERPMSVYSQVVKSMARAGRISIQDLASLPRHSSMYSASSRAASTRSGSTTPRCPQTPILTFSALPPVDDADDIPVAPEIVVEEPTSDLEVTPTTPTTTKALSPTPVPRTPTKTSMLPLPNSSSQIVDPSDRALNHLVNVLGFSPADAKWALTRSENGHGIDMTRAIEMLVNGGTHASNTIPPIRGSGAQHHPRPRSPPTVTRHSRSTSPPPSSSPGPLSPALITRTPPTTITIRSTEPVEVDTVAPRPAFARKKSAITFGLGLGILSPSSLRDKSSALLGVSTNGVSTRDSVVSMPDDPRDEMSDKERERANIMRMREKSYRVLGIGSGLAGQGNSFGKADGLPGVGGQGLGSSLGIGFGGRRFGSLVGKRRRSRV